MRLRSAEEAKKGSEEGEERKKKGLGGK